MVQGKVKWFSQEKGTDLSLQMQVKIIILMSKQSKALTYHLMAIMFRLSQYLVIKVQKQQIYQSNVELLNLNLNLGK